MVKVLVLDLTHGGEVLAAAYAERGDDVTAIDVYHTRSELKPVLGAQGIRVLDAAPNEHFALVAAPIHCPARFLGPATSDRTITHHQAVGELCHFTYPVIEVTGARGKTSTCQALARLLSTDRRVLLLTSRGLSVIEDGQETVIEDKVSIAPPTLLRLAKMPTYDMGVFEISLGGTGVGTVSVVTTLGDNYAIAGGTRKAYDGKVQMIAGAKGHVVFPAEEREVWGKTIPPGVEATTFGPTGEVELSFGALQLGQKVQATLRIGRTMEEVGLPGGFLAPAYATALSAAIAAAVAAGVERPRVLEFLSTFGGVPGRGEVTGADGRFLVRERNPGVSAGSVEWNLRALEAYGEKDIGLIIDPVNQKVCEKLDLVALRQVVAAHPAVRGAYLIHHPGWRSVDGFVTIADPSEVHDQHRTTLWCTKEGYL